MVEGAGGGGSSWQT